MVLMHVAPRGEPGGAVSAAGAASSGASGTWDPDDGASRLGDRSSAPLGASGACKNVWTRSNLPRAEPQRQSLPPLSPWHRTLVSAPIEPVASTAGFCPHWAHGIDAGFCPHRARRIDAGFCPHWAQSVGTSFGAGGCVTAWLILSSVRYRCSPRLGPSAPPSVAQPSVARTHCQVSVHTKPVWQGSCGVQTLQSRCTQASPSVTDTVSATIVRCATSLLVINVVFGSGLKKLCGKREGEGGASWLCVRQRCSRGRQGPLQ